MFVFHLLAGYRGSGKDSFYYYLRNENDYNFCILKNDEFIYPKFLNKENPIMVRIGLADEVKTLVHQDLNIKIENLDLLNLAKNHLYFYDKVANDYIPLRNFYIQKGMAMRDIDPDFWCKKAMENLSKDFVSSNEIINVFITDYRFINEKTYFEKFGKVITYRVFTSEVNGLNTTGIESEHSLDNTITDYLVLRNLEDLPYVKSLFPFYKNYI